MKAPPIRLQNTKTMSVIKGPELTPTPACCIKNKKTTFYKKSKKKFVQKNSIPDLNFFWKFFLKKKLNTKTKFSEILFNY